MHMGECWACENDPMAAFPFSSSSSSPQFFKETLAGSTDKGGGASQRNTILIFWGRLLCRGSVVNPRN